MWIQGIGEFSEDRLTVESLYTTGGTRWGNSFDPDQVDVFDWGSLTMEFNGCDSAQLDYESTTGLGFGTLQMQRLTSLMGISCDG